MEARGIPIPEGPAWVVGQEAHAANQSLEQPKRYSSPSCRHSGPRSHAAVEVLRSAEGAGRLSRQQVPRP